jgi:AcrR family transcriptional regulator
VPVNRSDVYTSTVRTTTREQILLAAEQLFAQHGIDAVSLREIAAAAKQGNNSAVQYHFGDRESLVRALYEWRLAPLNARRTELVAALAHTDTTPDAWVDAYARPLFEVADGSSWYARFVARFVAGYMPDLGPPFDEHYTSAMRVVIRRLRGTCADLPATLRGERIHRLQIYVTASIADVEQRRAADQRILLGAEATLQDIVTTAAAILTVR